MSDGDRRVHMTRLARACGHLVVAASLIYVGLRVHSNWQALSGWRPGIAIGVVGGISAVVYGIASFLLSAGWHSLLSAGGESRISVLCAHRIYGRTQIAKYLPGNVFHFAGRHVLGRRLGITHPTLVGATFGEVVGLVCAAAMISMAGLFFYPWLAPAVTSRVGSTSIVIASSAVVLAVYASASLAGRLGMDMSTWGWMRTLTTLDRVVGYYVVFFVVIGLLLYWLSATAAPALQFSQAGAVVTVFGAAWLAGYLVPGASAGIGVREAVLAAGLSDMLGESLAVAVALLFRVATICGDALYFFFASCVACNASSPSGDGRPALESEGFQLKQLDDLARHSSTD